MNFIYIVYIVYCVFEGISPTPFLSLIKRIEWSPLVSWSPFLMFGKTLRHWRHLTAFFLSGRNWCFFLGPLLQPRIDGLLAVPAVRLSPKHTATVAGLALFCLADVKVGALVQALQAWNTLIFLPMMSNLLRFSALLITYANCWFHIGIVSIF